jgi:hypothetical protein
MSFKVTLTNNQLTRTGRPDFISSTTKAIAVNHGEDRRHVFHGATQISDVLIESFNRIIRVYGITKLEEIIDRALQYFRSCGIKFKAAKDLVAKVTKVITIAFSSKKNLVVGSAIQNQGIEKARESICTIREKLGHYCLQDLRTFRQMQAETMKLIGNSIASSGKGDISQYRKQILELLQEAVTEALDILALVNILHEFEFSCTLDIMHDGTSKEQNIWGMTMANRLYRAIENKDENSIHQVLLYMN